MKRLHMNLDNRTAQMLEQRAALEERTATEIVRRSLEMYFEHDGRWCCPQHPTMAELLKSQGSSNA